MKQIIIRVEDQDQVDVIQDVLEDAEYIYITYSRK
mgnify:CR=1 FL=1